MACLMARALPLQLHADLLKHQQEASLEISRVAQDSRSQLRALDLDLKQLNRQAFQSLTDQRDTLTIKLTARRFFQSMGSKQF